METINWVIQNVTTLLLTSVVVAVTGLVIILVKPDSEAAVDYDVPLPQQCQPGWKGEVLENPSIKVRRSVK